MTMRMLIDARHREETRVAVVKGNRIEEFDFESAEHKQLKGNIYLAKVTRVEPSLQAAFVDYGGNRHGFLAFSEIHPDYYQIPKEDREALLREEAEHAAEEERLRGGDDHDDDHDDLDAVSSPAEAFEDDAPTPDNQFADDELDATAVDDEQHNDAAPPPATTASGNGIDEKAAEKLRESRMNLRRRYKIQDVIRRRQVLLVQVVKEERGNKGAALTTYLSLAGRYCVLMPNTSHGGGISRKISNAVDRKRLKSIMADLDLPKTMGCIVRTAGLQRTKVEIRRDFDYLARLWDEIRETTLKSAAPALIYQDSDLIKRAIRDIYNKDIEEVIVEGAEGYAQAKTFMKLLMPSHARRVKPYVDTVPLFQRSAVEEQLSAMYNPVVQLKSGGYLVINPTEALVSIDINSGRSTREYGIEATAVGTNLEAAAEIARQLRLRDMAGLVVIDFIDMESSGNIRKVERAMKTALADDRARIQVGRISSFGLLEMSRQRLRTGVLEASTRQCPHCEGTGLVRTASSAGLSALRMLEDEAGRGRGSCLVLTCSKEAALYVLNRKRAELAEIELRYGVVIEVQSDNEEEGARMSVEVSGPPPVFAPRIEAPAFVDDDDDDIEEVEDDEDEGIASEDRERAEADADTSERPKREESEGGRRRRRRGRRGRRDDEPRAATDGEAGDAATVETVETGESDDSDDAPRDAEAAPAPRREDGESKRRGRRGGRRRRGRGGVVDGNVAGAADDGDLSADADAALATDGSDLVPELPPEADLVGDAVLSGPDLPDAVAAEPVKPRRGRKPKVVEDASGEDAAAEKPKRTRKPKAAAVEATAEVADDDSAPTEEKPKRARRAKASTETEPVAEETPVVDAATVALSEEAPPNASAPTMALAASDPTTAADDGPKRGGWWQRTFGS